VISPTSNPVPTIRGITLTMLISNQTHTINHLLLMKTPIIDTIRTSQYKGAKAELFFNLNTPTTGTGTSRLKIWLEAKFSLKSCSIKTKKLTQVPHLLIQKITPILKQQQIKTLKELVFKMCLQYILPGKGQEGQLPHQKRQIGAKE
jgi:hypothetical protein